jgi:VWFA-related protein
MIGEMRGGGRDTSKVTKTTTIKWVCLIVVLLVAGHSLWAISPQSQQGSGQKPVFRVGAHFVSVDAYPTKDGKIVEGLTRDDFDIYEDDKPQKIDTFEFISADARPPDDERSTMLTPREGLELAADPHYRVFVIVIDKGAIVKSTWEPLRKAIHEFLDSEVSPRDLVGLITTDQSWQDLVIGKRLSAIEEEIDSEEWLRREASEERLVLQGCDLGPLQARAKWDATYTLLESLVRVLGQVREDHSSIVFVANNIPRWARDDSGIGQQRTLTLPKTTLVNGRITRVSGDMHDQYCKSEAARLSDINFDQRFSGLTTSAQAGNVSFYPIRMAPVMPDVRRMVSPIESTVPPPGYQDRRWDAAHEDNFPDLAKKTDGFPVAMGDGLTKGLRRIASDIGAHYLLGYYTTNDNWDGKIRRITVRLKPRGTQIAARREYRAPTKAEMEALSSTRDAHVTARSPAVADALGTLSRIRPSAQFYAYGAVNGRAMTVTIEVPSEAVDAGRWSEGGTLELIADSADGQLVGTATGKLLGNGRAIVVVPLDGTARPSNLFVRLRADGESLTERVPLGPQTATLVGDPVAYRSGPRGTGVPVASFLFTHQERLRLDWPVATGLDKYDVRLLDQFGQPLQTRPDLRAVESPAGNHLVGEMSLAALGHGDYVVELTVEAGEKVEQKLTALRVR